MILEFVKDSPNVEAMKQYLTDRGLAVGEVMDDVEQ